MRRFIGVVSALGVLLIGALAAWGAEDPVSKEEIVESLAPISPLFVEGDDGLYRDCSPLIAVQVDQGGLFNSGAGTDESCEPTAGAWDLMYRWPGFPGTSYTTARVDGNDYRLGIDVQPTDVLVDDDSISHFYTVGGIRVAQTLSLDHSAAEEGDFDTVLVEYRALNPDPEPHQFALRAMIDTELNYNDGAPFQVPGSGGITTERQFLGAFVPEYVLAFEDFSDPVHIGAASFGLLESLPPKRLILGRWPGLYSSPFDYIPDPDASITADSAFAVYYEAPTGELTQNQTIDMAFQYGRPDVASDLQPPLGLSVAGPAEVEAGESFPVTAFITNLAAGPGTNVSTELALPAGMVTADPVRDLGDVEPGETVQVTWDVSVSATLDPGTYEFSVALGADDIPPKAVTRSVTVVGSVDPPDVFPLLGAHGITGSADDMFVARNVALSVLPDLDLSLFESSPTGAISSVWANGQTLADSATQLIGETGAPAVKVIAHSKGGLDTRAAMTYQPELFADLGMLATPNGGSVLADVLCGLRLVGGLTGDRIKHSMGPCLYDGHGLYNLQTWWVQHVFNPEVDRTAAHDFYVASGDCIGTEGSVGCTEMGFSCVDFDGDGDRDGDNVVCVDSAFNQTPIFDGGRHQPVYPIYAGLDHSQMREDPCPITGVLARLYPTDIDLGAVNDVCPGSISSQIAQPQMPAEESSETFQLGSVAAVEIGTDGVGEVPLKADGSSQLSVILFAEPGEIEAVELRLSTGDVVTPDSEGTTALFGSPVSTYTFSTGGDDGVLVITGEPGAAIGVAAAVRSNVSVHAEVTPVGFDEVQVDVTIEGAPPSIADTEGVKVVIPTEAPTEVALAVAEVSGAEITYSGVVTVPTGRSVPIHVHASGPVNRVLFTGIVLPDGTGSLDGIAGQQLTDVDGDGIVDALDVDIAVTTATSGDHNVSFSLVADRQIAGGAYGAATLDAGSGLVTVRIWLEDLAAAGTGGPFEVVDALLTRGENHTWVDRRASMGTLQAIALEDLGGIDLTMSRPSSSSVDSDNDGLFDVLAWDWLGWIPSPGDYVVTGTLLGPDGSRVQTFEDVLNLEAGVVDLSQEFDGSVVGSTGDGSYTLTGLRLASVADSSDLADAPDGMTDVLRSAEWVGGTPNIQTLIRYWDNADADGQIPHHGFYTSQRLRLVRMQQDLSDGSTAKAIGELERFIDQVAGASASKIDSDAAARIVSYAEGLLADLG